MYEISSQFLRRLLFRLYSGKTVESGWWQYDELSSASIEADFQITGKLDTEIEICGFKYKIDFDQMIQSSIEHPERRRKIKRETRIKDLNIKGVAGLRLKHDECNEGCESQDDVNDVCDAISSIKLSDDQSTTE